MLKAMFSNHGVLGINARNLLYVKPFNPKKATALADNKLKTKAFLMARGIPAARIYARIESREQLRDFDFSKLPNECVLKPNFGFGGEGIVILKGRNKKGQFTKSSGTVVTNEEMIEHIEDILDGRFSLGGRRDTAFFEQILVPHDCFAPFRPVGLPDLRIIVFNLVPVMAMLRIPTAASDGKANLHLGGMGIGIDIAKGTTTHAAQYHGMIDELPHGGSPSGHQIPYWDDILLVCSRIQQMTNIGYLAVDITLDQQMGPAVLEVNARAGLNVQIANLAPLRKRLQRVQGIKVGSPEKGVRLGQDLFGEKLRESESKKSGAADHILGLQETITIVGDGQKFEEPAILSATHDRTAFTQDLIDTLLKEEAIELDDDSTDRYRVKFTLGTKKIQTLVKVVESLEDGVRVSIGRRDLQGFLIDPSKKKTPKIVSTGAKSDLRAVDKSLAQLDRDLLLLKYVKPVNLDEERQRLLEDKKYNPVFQYKELELDIDDVKRRLADPISDQSPLGQLLEKKRQELSDRLTLLEARGDSDSFTQASIALFGKPTPTLIKTAKQMIAQRDACELPAPNDKQLDAQQVKKKFEDIIKKYSLHNWKIAVRQKLVADCTVGGGNIYIREGALFAPERVEALIKHEIETHVLTAENGDHQPYELFRRGTASYLDTQEGLATYNQNLIYGENHEQRYNPPRNLLGVVYALDHSLADTRRYLCEELGYSATKALTQAITLKRGLRDTSDPGGFTKSLVYLRGLLAIEDFVAKGGDCKRLYIGKVTLDDLELIEKVADLQPPLLIPEFLRDK